MKPGVVLFSTVVSAYAAVGDLANAKRVVMEMSAAPKSWKAAPNERTFGHLVWGYGEMGDVAGITQSAQMMIDQGLSLRMGSAGRKSLVRACRECGLPASHVDKMVDTLTPKRRNGKGGRAMGQAQARRRRLSRSGARPRRRGERRRGCQTTRGARCEERRAETRVTVAVAVVATSS